MRRNRDRGGASESRKSVPIAGDRVPQQPVNDVLTGATLPVLVSGFVYNVSTYGPFLPNDEVKDAFWVRLRELVDARRHRERSFRIENAERRFPAIDLAGSGRRVLWGISYRLVAQLLTLLGHPVSSTQSTPDAGRHQPGAER